MSIDRSAGTTPLDGLAAYFDRRFSRCPACGFEDDDVHWTAHSDGRSVEYRHTCPSCDAVDRRTLEFD